MPRALEPGATFEVVLESDKDKPVETRPCLVCPSLIARAWGQVWSFYERAMTSSDGTWVDDLLAALKIGVNGWRNFNDPQTSQPIAFDPAEFDRVFQRLELFEAVGKVAREGNVSADDAKKSESPPSSVTDLSAVTNPVEA